MRRKSRCASCGRKRAASNFDFTVPAPPGFDELYEWWTERMSQSRATERQLKRWHKYPSDHRGYLTRKAAQKHVSAIYDEYRRLMGEFRQAAEEYLKEIGTPDQQAELMARRIFGTGGRGDDVPSERHLDAVDRKLTMLRAPRNRITWKRIPDEVPADVPEKFIDWIKGNVTKVARAFDRATEEGRKSLAREERRAGYFQREVASEVLDTYAEERWDGDLDPDWMK